MASIRKQGKRYEIRECLSTDRGPRQRTLVSFQGVLSPEVLDLAEAKASKPLKRDELVARAAAMDIPVGSRRRFQRHLGTGRRAVCLPLEDRRTARDRGAAGR